MSFTLKHDADLFLCLGRGSYMLSNTSRELCVDIIAQKRSYCCSYVPVLYISHIDGNTCLK